MPCQLIQFHSCQSAHLQFSKNRFTLSAYSFPFISKCPVSTFNFNFLFYLPVCIFNFHLLCQYIYCPVSILLTLICAVSIFIKPVSKFLSCQHIYSFICPVSIFTSFFQNSLSAHSISSFNSVCFIGAFLQPAHSNMIQHNYFHFYIKIECSNNS